MTTEIIISRAISLKTALILLVVVAIYFIFALQVQLSM